MSATLSILQSAYAGPHASKRMARDAGVSWRTAEKWALGLFAPRADVLLRMAQENAALRAEMMRAMNGSAYAGLVSDDARATGPKAGAVVGQGGGAAAVSPAVAYAGPERRRSGV